MFVKYESRISSNKMSKDEKEELKSKKNKLRIMQEKKRNIYDKHKKEDLEKRNTKMY